MSKTFQQALQDGLFPVGTEIVAPRGVQCPAQSASLKLAKELLSDERVNYVSITDNPGGNPMLPPDWLAGQLADYAPNVIVHLACKDFNRAGLESQLWRYASEGFENVLVLTGDLPADGFPSQSGSVFDYDSVNLLSMMTAMNAGLPVKNRRGQPETLPRVNFFAGCAVNPFKYSENEFVPQLAKLLKKVKAGAKWVIPQLGYDMQRFKEVKLFLEQQGFNVPFIGNAFVLTKGIAKLIKSGKLAGCVVSDSLLADIEKYATGADKGKVFFKELAAKQIAVFRGLGFAGTHIGGIEKPETFFEIIDLSKTFENDWQTLYEEIQYRQQPAASARKKKHVSLFYRFSRLVHAAAFHRGHGLYPLIKRSYRFLESGKYRFLPSVLHGIEYHSKNVLYNCTDCGDCGLPDTAYLCPMNRCSKNQRNGPCGGSNNGRCEADDKPCIWTLAYDRLKCFNEWREFEDKPPIVYNAALKGTSAWANLYLDRDHSAADNG
ncbi:MAG: methylenetetrahydrofolate reductase C-terminal domain-containing protein [Planctomycetaceae bacterium]|jgi:methylenetetrahydrofolate reductase (NADPH)|nr:methylenetetrahydrofolate reductase C-terminal domain-containing protein [Planctomycetaceae bacterium]